MHLRSQLNANPCNVDALRQHGDYMQKLGHKEVTKRLRSFRPSAVRASGDFFRKLSSWLLRPFESSSPSPYPECALSKLPANPVWDPKGALAMLQDTFQERPHMSEKPPTWNEFVSCLNTAKTISLVMDLCSSRAGCRASSSYPQTKPCTKLIPLLLNSSAHPRAWKPP